MADTLFVSNSCAYCHVVTDAMARSGRRLLDVRNVDQEPQSKAELLRLGARSVPTAVISGLVYLGAPEILAALRAKHGPVL